MVFALGSLSSVATTLVTGQFSSDPLTPYLLRIGKLSQKVKDGPHITRPDNSKQDTTGCTSASSRYPLRLI